MRQGEITGSGVRVGMSIISTMSSRASSLIGFDRDDGASIPSMTHAMRELVVAIFSDL